MSTVTGRTYTVTMPRGFAPWRPRCATLGLLDTIRGVLAEYDDQLPLTARQVFYRLVGAHGYDKTEAAYDRLCETLCCARRVGLITTPYQRMTAGSPHASTARASWLPWVALLRPGDAGRGGASAAAATDGPATTSSPAAAHSRQVALLSR